MTLLLGGTVPDFTADTTTGPISFHDWIGDDWAFFFTNLQILPRSARPRWDARHSWPTHLHSAA